MPLIYSMELLFTRISSYVLEYFSSLAFTFCGINHKSRSSGPRPTFPLFSAKVLLCFHSQRGLAVQNVLDILKSNVS